MDEKTEELRDIFLDVADDETVTESQQADRGLLAPDGESVENRLLSVIEQLSEKFEMTTDLPMADRRDLVRLFYAGDDDEEIAADLDCSTAEVFRTRMDLHLVRDDDAPDGLESELRNRLDEDDATIAADSDAATVRRTRAVIEARNRSRRVSHRFRTAFEEILTDADLSVRHAADAQEDGLEDATEGAETNVDF